MALLFGNAVSDRVVHGSGSSITTTLGTILIWTYPTSVANVYKVVISKYQAAGGWAFFKRGVDGTQLRFLQYKSGGAVAAAIDSSTGTLAANSWQFIGATWNDSNWDSEGKIYRGSLSLSVADRTLSTVTPSGIVSNSGASLTVGNQYQNDSAWVGSIGFVGMWNRVLSLGEIQAQQFRPHVTDGCVLFTRLATINDQPDWSGNGNTGTVTGATSADHVPLGPWFGSDLPRYWSLSTNTYNEALALAKAKAITQTGLVDFFVTISAGGVVEDSLGLAKSLGIVESATADLSDSLNLSRQSGITSLANLTLSSVLSLNKVLTTADLSNLEAFMSVVANKDLGISDSGILGMDTALSLAKFLTIVVNTGASTYEVALTLAKQAGIIESSVHLLTDSVSLGKSLDLTDSSTVEFLTAVSLLKILTTDFSNSSEMTTSLLLTKLLDIMGVSTVFQTVVTILTRTLRVPLEQREVVPVENRSVVVEYENRNYYG